jgi:hypothetical protein
MFLIFGVDALARIGDHERCLTLVDGCADVHLRAGRVWI